jgi:hypothetical protein
MKCLKLEPPQYKNVYKLVISNMSGDADAYEETINFFDKKYEPLIEDIIELCKWSNSKWPSINSIEKNFKNIKLKYPNYFAPSDDEDGYYDSDDSIITRDTTADREFVCRPSVVSLTWFDDKGIEYEVSY